MNAFRVISAILLGLSTLGAAAQKDQQSRSAKPRAEAKKSGRLEPGEKFKHFDTDGDGKMSRKEAPPRLRENFDRLDITKDGFITQREFRAAAKAGESGRKDAPGSAPEEVFKRFDANNDGKISPKEAPPRLQQSFDRLDITRDGFITLREFRAAQSGNTVRKEAAGAPSGAAPDEVFKRFDTNGDGKISREEAPERLRQSFDRFDITKDGFVTLREFNAARSAQTATPARPQRPRR